MARFIRSRGLGEDHMEGTTSSLCDLSKRDSSLGIQRLAHKDSYNAAQDAAGRCDRQTPAMTDSRLTYSRRQGVYSHNGGIDSGINQKIKSEPELL